MDRQRGRGSKVGVMEEGWWEGPRRVLKALLVQLFYRHKVSTMYQI